MGIWLLKLPRAVCVEQKGLRTLAVETQNIGETFQGG